MYTYIHIQAHGGDIAVSSTVGEGTTFTIRIPCKSVGDNTSNNMTGTPNSNTPSLRFLGDASVMSLSDSKSMLNNTKKDSESEAHAALSPAFSLGTPVFLKSFDRESGKFLDRDPGKNADRESGKFLDRDPGKNTDQESGKDVDPDARNNVDRDANAGDANSQSFHEIWRQVDKEPFDGEAGSSNTHSVNTSINSNAAANAATRDLNRANSGASTNSCIINSGNEERNSAAAVGGYGHLKLKNVKAATYDCVERVSSRGSDGMYIYVCVCVCVCI
jgi:hypothetical protein